MGLQGFLISQLKQTFGMPFWAGIVFNQWMWAVIKPT
jgi:hypothetical protein